MDLGYGRLRVVVEPAQRRVRSQHEIGAGAWLFVLSLGNIRDGPEILAQFVILRIAHQPDHQELRIRMFAELLAPERASYRILSLKDLARKLLIHNRRLGRAEIVVHRNRAPQRKTFPWFGSSPDRSG